MSTTRLMYFEKSVESVLNQLESDEREQDLEILQQTNADLMDMNEKLRLTS